MINYAYRQANNVYRQANNFWHRNRVDIAEASATVTQDPNTDGKINLENLKNQTEDTSHNIIDLPQSAEKQPRGTILSNASTALDSDSGSDKGSKPASPLNNALQKTMPEVEDLTHFAGYFHFLNEKYDKFNDLDEEWLKYYEHRIAKMVYCGEQREVLDLPPKENEALVELYKKAIAYYDGVIRYGWDEMAPYSSDPLDKYPRIFGPKTAVFAQLYLSYLRNFYDKSSLSNTAYVDSERYEVIDRASTLYKKLRTHIRKETAKITNFTEIFDSVAIAYELDRENKAFASLSDEVRKDDMLYSAFLIMQRVKNTEAAAEKQYRVMDAFIKHHIHRLNVILRQKEKEDNDNISVDSYDSGFFARTPLPTDTRAAMPTSSLTYPY